LLEEVEDLARLVNEDGVVVMEQREVPTETCATCGRSHRWAYVPDRGHVWALVGYRSSKTASSGKHGWYTYCPRCLEGMKR
jgi:hypothetical protein